MPSSATCVGATLETRNTRSRCPAIARPINSSERPLLYPSAVSINVIPRESPVRSASSSTAAGCLPSPRCQEPWPIAGTTVPSRNLTVWAVPFEVPAVAASRAEARDEATNEPRAPQSPLNSRRLNNLAPLFPARGGYAHATTCGLNRNSRAKRRVCRLSLAPAVSVEAENTDRRAWMAGNKGHNSRVCIYEGHRGRGHDHCRLFRDLCSVGLGPVGHGARVSARQALLSSAGSKKGGRKRPRERGSARNISSRGVAVCTTRQP